MARVVKPNDKHIAFRMLSDANREWEMTLVKGGKFAYIWTPMGTYSGTVALRKLANAILKEIPAYRSKP